MKKAVYIVCVVFLFVFSGCQKYKQSQPAYLSFNWAFTANTFDNSKVILTGGYFYSNQVNVSGKRNGAPDVSIEQNFPVQKFTYQNAGSIGVNVDVPVGDYTDFDVNIKIDGSSNPCIGLKGLYFNGSDSIPVLIELTTSDPLAFKAVSGFSLKKKNSYTVALNLDVNKIFSSVSSLQWSQASISMEEGIPTVVIRSSYNAGIYNDIVEEIQNSLSLVVQ